MNIASPQLTKSLKPIITFIKKYMAVFFIVLGISVLGFLVYRVGQLATQEPSDELITEKSGENRPIRIDAKAVEQVQKLQSTNVEVQALFNQSRDNPFNE